MKLNDKIEILYYVNYKIKLGNEIKEQGIRLNLLECYKDEILYYENIKISKFPDAKYVVSINPKYRKSYIPNDPFHLYVKDLPIIYEEATQ